MVAKALFVTVNRVLSAPPADAAFRGSADIKVTATIIEHSK
jgi:hypothetical protein